MKKILLPGDSIVIDGVEFSEEKIKEILKNNIINKRKTDFLQQELAMLRATYCVGGSSE